MNLIRVNVGCGQTPTKGWKNFDNSPSILLARVPFLPMLLRSFRLLDDRNYEFIQFAKTYDIQHVNATKGLPLANASVDVIYSSHMLEHLDRDDANAFLREAKRLLRPGGIIRLAVPNLRRLADRYMADGDADDFIASQLTCVPSPKTLTQRIKLAWVGPRHHVWMYDAASLSKLLRGRGFIDPVALAAGATTIADPGPLDLHERSDEGLYVEARMPS